MSDALYTAMREFVRVSSELEIRKGLDNEPRLKAIQGLMDAVRSVQATLESQATEIRSLKVTLETRSAPTVIEGPPGPAGPRGEKGDTGERGVDGIGKDGRDGKDGTPSTIPGPKGDRGETGERGAEGVTGINGRDGVPSTVPGPKGDTGERGADGIGTREELRAAALEINADLQVRGFADIYKGVYKSGELYTRSSFTTWGGSLWLALVDTKAKPGENTDWRLVVKR